jgi:hypothetical protein
MLQTTPVPNHGNTARVACASRRAARLACQPGLASTVAPAPANPGQSVSRIVLVTGTSRTAGVASTGIVTASAGLHVGPGHTVGIFSAASCTAIALATADRGTHGELAVGSVLSHIDKKRFFVLHSQFYVIHPGAFTGSRFIRTPQAKDHGSAISPAFSDWL